ncbi:MAG: hypothetical protein ACPG3T_03630 [Pseudomonadales bacterium]
MTTVAINRSFDIDADFLTRALDLRFGFVLTPRLFAIVGVKK